jgi:hypothetical protein
MTGTMRNIPADDDDALILEKEVNDSATDYKAKQDNKSEVNDDLGVLGQADEIIQPVVKTNGISEDHIKMATDAWIELLKKGELNIGRVFYKNIFQIKPDLMKLYNPKDMDQKSLI